MIKILATSDWHLGEYFHSSDRLKEQQHFLSWLKQKAATLQPDALLVAGDVFDNSNPSAAAQETYYNFLSEITEACPDMTIVVIAGNHRLCHTPYRSCCFTEKTSHRSKRKSGPSVDSFR